MPKPGLTDRLAWLTVPPTRTVTVADRLAVEAGQHLQTINGHHAEPVADWAIVDTFDTTPPRLPADDLQTNLRRGLRS